MTLQAGQYISRKDVFVNLIGQIFLSIIFLNGGIIIYIVNRFHSDPGFTSSFGPALSATHIMAAVSYCTFWLWIIVWNIFVLIKKGYLLQGNQWLKCLPVLLPQPILIITAILLFWRGKMEAGIFILVLILLLMAQYCLFALSDYWKPYEIARRNTRPKYSTASDAIKPPPSYDEIK